MNKIENPYLRDKIYKLVHKANLYQVHKELKQVEKHIFLIVETDSFVTNFKFPNKKFPFNNGIYDYGMICGTLEEFSTFYSDCYFGN